MHDRERTEGAIGWRERIVRALLARRGIARTVNGIPLRVDPVGRHVFTPIYDEGAAACLRDHLREGMEAWNVGANIGVYALQLAHRVGAAGRVVAFEPNPAARAVLARNLAHNSLQSRVEVVPAAVGVGARHRRLLHLGRRRHGSRRPAQSAVARDGPD